MSYIESLPRIRTNTTTAKHPAPQSLMATVPQKPKSRRKATESRSTSSRSTGRMHRVLSVPELLNIVFSYLERRDCAIAARVTRSWNDLALDHVWRVLTDLAHLFRLLGELVLDGNGELCFPRGTPDFPQWDKYETAARRVLYFDMDEDCSPVSTELLLAISSLQRARGHVHLLPRIRSISWSYELGIQTPPIGLATLLSPSLSSLRILSVRLPAVVGEYALSNFINLIGGLTPTTMEELEIVCGEGYDVSAARCQERLISFFRGQRFLKGLELPMLNLSPSIFDVVASQQLVQLNVGHRVSGNTELFLSVISRNCPSLTSLWLTMCSRTADPEIHEIQLVFNMLEPLLKITALEDFQLFANRPLKLSRANIYAMGHAWPRIRTLVISTPSPEIGFGEASATPIRYLTHFAEAFATGSLQNLGHTFASSSEIPNARNVTKALPPSLKSLGLGFYQLHPASVMPLAGFLGALCPGECGICRPLPPLTFTAQWYPFRESEMIRQNSPDGWGVVRLVASTVQDAIRGRMGVAGSTGPSAQHIREAET